MPMPVEIVIRLCSGPMKGHVLVIPMQCGCSVVYQAVYARLVRTNNLGPMEDYEYHLLGKTRDRGYGRFHNIANLRVEDGDVLILTHMPQQAHATACDPGECKDDCHSSTLCKPAEPKNNGERETCFWCGTPTKRVSATICFCPKCQK